MASKLVVDCGKPPGTKDIIAENCTYSKEIDHNNSD